MIRATILVFALHSVAGAQPLANALFRLNEIDLHYHSGMERPVSLDEWLRMAAADGRRVVALTDHLELYRKTPAEYEAWRAKGKFEARYPLGAPGHTALMRDFESAAQRHKLILFKAWEIYEGELDTGVEAAPMGMVDLIGWHISPNHAGAPPDGKLLLKRVAQIKEVQKRFPVPMILFHPFPMRLEHIQRKAKADGRDLASIRVDEYRFFQPGEQEQLAAMLRGSSIYVEISRDTENYWKDPIAREALIADTRPLAEFGVQFTISTDAHSVAHATRHFEPEKYCEAFGVTEHNTNGIVRELLAIEARKRIQK